MAQTAFPDRIDGVTLRRWMIRASVAGLATGLVAGMAALLN